MRVTVDFSWRDLGALSLSSSRITFPETPAEPGIYRFDLGDRVYIGEADQLKRRFQGYRTPGVAHAANIRLNATLIALLQRGLVANVAIVTDANVDIDGTRVPLDLGDKPARVLLENAALVAERRTGKPLEKL
jgi:hypothetical protein